MWPYNKILYNNNYAYQFATIIIALLYPLSNNLLFLSLFLFVNVLYINLGSHWWRFSGWFPLTALLWSWQQIVLGSERLLCQQIVLFLFQWWNIKTCIISGNSFRVLLTVLFISEDLWIRFVAVYIRLLIGTEEPSSVDLLLDDHILFINLIVVWSVLMLALFSRTELILITLASNLSIKFGWRTVLIMLLLLVLVIEIFEIFALKLGISATKLIQDRLWILE
jgi:hypothetical protein